MSFLKGASLIGSLLLAPAGFGTAAHFLKSYYRDIMNFEGAYFIVEAITDLYDKGIPKIPDSVLKEAKKIAEDLEREKSKNSQNGNTSNSSSGGRVLPKVQKLMIIMNKNKKFLETRMDFDVDFLITLSLRKNQEKLKM
ncbi:hypothetical protein [Mycoplasma parvum]|uniref:Uncharacterized protein n=1 Tax=Mycoplasma parvum str. Indiana TaxID=1403316 RepID=U5NCJ1_9MOLU|nr:hypothetical protein [Mycoplasma parvum]AGX89040.1 hypothetical protein PRV_01400 [Mycoplasma parvum str. Indiana]